MKFLIMSLQISTLFVLFTGKVLAEPQNGFGLNAGVSSHKIKYQCATCGSYSTSGVSIGFDYQFALSNNFSINPFLMASGESASIYGGDTNHSILGLQLRYWAENIFFGGHLGSYKEDSSIVAIDGFSLPISGSGGGAGLVAGWEKPDGGLYVMGQLDSATLTWPAFNANTKLSAFRLSAGYRWK